MVVVDGGFAQEELQRALPAGPRRPQTATTGENETGTDQREAFARLAGLEERCFNGGRRAAGAVLAVTTKKRRSREEEEEKKKKRRRRREEEEEEQEEEKKDDRYKMVKRRARRRRRPVLQEALGGEQKNYSGCICFFFYGDSSARLTAGMALLDRTF
ncbi:hypothetical protein TEQG_06290 [Trichophyton equinum CBS 127.97]|uniref:Uncharacterized protein n=1 Tax=Trichophyton equinum (strain ATCC MYA-4606 / CBS 127.97) TaxID=559882 RepID=F2PZ99_TRIEC|nr:hypothetical protein TEQG_06290 [Trichophyton equinum CBS 127.97]